MLNYLRGLALDVDLRGGTIKIPEKTPVRVESVVIDATDE